MTRTRELVLVGVAIGLLAAALAPSTKASCGTHRCWHRVHVHHLERMVERKIAAITPYRCYGERSVKPCFIIRQESATSGLWRAWNPQPVSGYHARGLYQLLGHGEPWPVIIGSRLAGVHPWVSARYETLKRKLTHHRIARALPMSAWGF